MSSIASAGSPDSNPFAVLPAGDLDWDGRADAVGVASYETGGVPVASVRALRGFDGHTLWTRETPADYSMAVPLPIGVPARDGVIVASYRVLGTPVGPDAVFLVQLEVVALAGWSGKELWRLVKVGSVAASPSGVVMIGLPYVVGPMHATAGSDRDLLVGVDSLIDNPSGGFDAVGEALLVDGRDGAIRSRSELATTNRFPSVRRAKDLSGDGLDDLVILGLAYEPPGDAIAFRGADGTRLWGRVDVPVWTYSGWVAGDDVTGDGRGDFLVAGGIGLFGATGSGSERQAGGSVPACDLCLLDGGTGEVKWRLSGRQHPRFLGDVNGDGVGDLGTIESSYYPLAIRYEALAGDGSEIYSQSHRPSSTADDDAGSLRIWRDAGDVDGDGTLDAAHLFTATVEEGTVSEWGVVDGRSGALRWAGTFGEPLRASVDAAGDDGVVIEHSSGVTTIAVRDGRDGSLVWSSTVLGLSSKPEASAADMNGDGRAEIILNQVVGPPHAVVLRGTDGGRIW